MINNVIDDQAHRELAKEMLVSASSAHEINVESIDFGEHRPDWRYAWLCYLADPITDNRVAALTITSAADHLRRFNPNGFLSNSGSRVSAIIHELETSNEAPWIFAGPHGEDVPFSPWAAHLVIVRATFDYDVLVS
jgi:hypothetical protein